MNKTTSGTRAFTLIELLIVIAIIAILTGVILVSLTSAKSRSRDGKRISDASQIQLALEQYFDRCSQYPSEVTDTAANNGCPSGITMATFIAKIPTPPTGGPSGANYDYAIVGGNNTDYVIHTQLETSVDSLKDSLTGTQGGFTCYSGAANTNGFYDYCIGPK